MKRWGERHLQINWVTGNHIMIIDSTARIEYAASIDYLDTI